MQRPTSSPQHRPTLRAEALEPRQLMALTPISAEMIVPAELQGSQFTSFDAPQAVAALPTGGVAVVWTDSFSDPRGDVYLRFLSTTGVPVTADINVSEDKLTRDTRATVAVDSQGDLLIVWSRQESQPSSYDIYARRYSSSGAAKGNPFRVNTTTLANQSRPSVAMNAAGQAVVVWASDRQDGSSYGVYARRYAPTGAPLTGEIPVNEKTARAQSFPSVAMERTGEFVVAWTSEGQDGDSLGVFARAFDGAGAPRTGEVLVNASVAGAQAFPSVDLGSNKVYIGWTSTIAGNSTVMARVFNATLGSPSNEINLGDKNTGNQVMPDLTALPGGGFAATWSQFSKEGSDWDVFLREYGVSLIPAQDAQRVNTQIAQAQIASSITSGPGGSVTVVWTSRTINGIGQDVKVRRYVDNLPPSSGTPLEYQIQEGESLTLDGSTSTDPNLLAGDAIVRYVWQFTGLGGPLETSQPIKVLTWSELVQLGIDDNGNYSGFLTVTDRFGAADSQPFRLTVVNTAPTARLTGANSQAQSVYSLTVGPASDPGDDTVVQYQINWGNDRVTQSSVPGTFTQSFAPGRYLIKLTLRDEDGTHRDVATKSILILVNGAQSAAAPVNKVVVQAEFGTPREPGFSRFVQQSWVFPGRSVWEQISRANAWDAAHRGRKPRLVK